MPAFSIVLPVRDREVEICEAVRSVIGQSLTDWELIVVDDGSRDRTADSVSAIADPRLRLVSQEPLGVSAARNRGATEARGRWITFLDSDDLALGNWLATFSSLLDSPSTSVACLGARIEPAGSGKPIVVRPRFLGPAYDNSIGLYLAGSFALSRELFLDIGGYETSLRYSENTELALRLTATYRERRIGVGASDQIQLVYRSSVRSRRPSVSQVQARLHSALVLLERHGKRLARDSRLHASYWAIAGVAACRLGSLHDGRRYFRRAVEIRPLDLRHAARYLLSVVPMNRLLWQKGVRADAGREV